MNFRWRESSTKNERMTKLYTTPSEEELAERDRELEEWERAVWSEEEELVERVARVWSEEELALLAVAELERAVEEERARVLAERLRVLAEREMAEIVNHPSEERFEEWVLAERERAVADKEDDYQF